MTRLYGAADGSAGDSGAGDSGAGDCWTGDCWTEVRRRDDQPEQFLWRDRLYLVRAVLDHWVEAGGWWRAARHPAASGAGAGAATAGPISPAGPISSVSPVDDGEREFWRVEAGFGRLGETGVYDLCFDWSPGRWTVVRVQD